MGRGLSPLQRTMLLVAWRNVQAEGRPLEGASKMGRRGGADAYYHEVLSEAFGVYWRRWDGQQRAWVRIEDKRLKSFNTGERERPARMCDWYRATRIDPPGFNRASAKAAISRAVLRLQERGLVVAMRGGCWSGYDLTQAGRDLAAQFEQGGLSANQVEPVPTG